jgi:CRP/FNR family transcriptional regulator, cyclic AMP receptor protein
MATDAAEVAGILRQTVLLCSVPPQDLAAVAAASRVRRFGRGQVVFTAGDRSDTLVVVISGRVKVVVRSADGGELTLTVIQPGGTFGEIGVADGGPRSADAEALDETRLLFVPGELINELCSRVPSVAQAMLSLIVASIRRLTEAASDLVFLDLPRRVAKVLLGLPRGDGGEIEQRMSQEELAHLIGGTRQSVNAALRGFERRGWIDVEGRMVTVQQPEALARFAGQPPHP